MRLRTLVTFAFLFSAPAMAASTFMPENDLHLEDCADCKATNAMTEDLFGRIVKAGSDAYAGEASARRERLVVNALWKDATVNANACRSCKPGEVTINMYGGLARRAEVLPESFALVLCHELGHAYGGTPYIAPSTQMSAEGQADFYSTNACFERVFSRVPELRTTHSTYEPFVEKACGENRRCKNALAGAKGLGHLLSVLSREEAPRFETPDPTVVTRTLLSYPDTVQCRLDTYLAGQMLKPRPACWFKK